MNKSQFQSELAVMQQQAARIADQFDSIKQHCSDLRQSISSLRTRAKELEDDQALTQLNKYAAAVAIQTTIRSDLDAIMSQLNTLQAKGITVPTNSVRSMCNLFESMSKSLVKEMIVTGGKR